MLVRVLLELPIGKGIKLFSPEERANGHAGRHSTYLALRRLRTGRLEWRTAPQWHHRQAARTAGTHPAPAARARGADGHARAIAPASLAIRHLRRFRPQPEFCCHEAPRGLGRLGRQTSLHRNHPEKGVSLCRAHFPTGGYAEWRRFASNDCKIRTGWTQHA